MCTLTLMTIDLIHFSSGANPTNPTTSVPTESGLATGTINFGDSLSSAAGAALVSLQKANALANLQKATASAEHQLGLLQQKQVQYTKLQQQKANLEQKLIETNSGLSTFQPYNSELFPPTPKNTPFFMTPPLTPPNESYQNINHDPDPGKPPSGKGSNKVGGLL